MADLSKVEILLNGKVINQFSSLFISQTLFDHHSFRLVCPTESIDGYDGEIFKKSKDFIGEVISFKITSVNATGTLKFTGVITQIESSRHGGNAGDLILSGYSPT